MAMLNMVVYQIDELQDSSMCFQEVKRVSKRLSQEIIKTHGGIIASLWKIANGEDTMKDVMTIFEGACYELAKSDAKSLTIFLELAKGLRTGTVEIGE